MTPQESLNVEAATLAAPSIKDNNAMNEERGRSAPAGVGPQWVDVPISPDEDTTPSTMLPAGLWPLKTKAESRAQHATVQAWSIEVPAKAANTVLTFLKENIKDQDSVDLQHLRRFAKARFLPPHLVPEEPEVVCRPSTSRSNSNYSDQARRPSSVSAISSSTGDGTGKGKGNKTRSRSSRSSRSSRTRRSTSPATLHLLICPTSVIDEASLKEQLVRVSPFWEGTYPLKLRHVTVPLLAPTTPEQAEQWTKQYWPTMYRKTNPFGPHPTIISKAEEEIRADGGVERNMALAKRVAAETHTHGCGASVGCVVIERPPEKAPEIVAVAGDARLQSPEGSSCAYPNVMTHSVMRAIGMVARKRVRVAAKEPQKLDEAMAVLDINKPSKKPDPRAPRSAPESLLDYPLTPMEQNAFDVDNLIANGYLCVDLEIYITHEPCMMCSMAILHSRFARCVFGQRMDKTGALTADNTLGYGLFWRPELNWKLLCWEYVEPNDDESSTVPALPEDCQV